MYGDIEYHAWWHSDDHARRQWWSCMMTLSIMYDDIEYHAWRQWWSCMVTLSTMHEYTDDHVLWHWVSCMKTLMIMRSHHTVKKKKIYTFFTNEVTVFTYCHLLLFYAVRFLLSFKGTVQRDFRPPAGPLNNGLKYFRVWLRIHWLIRFLGWKNLLPGVSYPGESKNILMLELFQKWKMWPFYSRIHIYIVYLYSRIHIY